ncbi:MAG: pyridoxine 5'-phosphate synthase [Planctomycetaceae bacterium]|nr:MAG: pyridoxine 5'-phosphate synthase [Planctomycetaceae bacterium]
MTHLSVNLNKVALLRNSRDSGIPSVVHAARLCIQAGADGITVHPRPDQRHIRPSDVWELHDMLTVEFNIEGNPCEPSFLELVLAVRPTQCTLVPDTRDQKTSDHGWDLPAQSELLKPYVERLKQQGIRVSVFVDPKPEVMTLVKSLGADRVELYTGPYAAHYEQGWGTRAWEPYTQAARAAHEVGLEVNAGHDLNLHNLGVFLRHVTGVAEVSIGHALIADALEWGLPETVRRYKAICQQSAASQR